MQSGLKNLEEKLDIWRYNIIKEKENDSRSNNKKISLVFSVEKTIEYEAKRTSKYFDKISENQQLMVNCKNSSRARKKCYI